MKVAPPTKKVATSADKDIGDGPSKTSGKENLPKVIHVSTLKTKFIVHDKRDDTYVSPTITSVSRFFYYCFEFRNSFVWVLDTR